MSLCFFGSDQKTKAFPCRGKGFCHIKKFTKSRAIPSAGWFCTTAAATDRDIFNSGHFVI